MCRIHTEQVLNPIVGTQLAKDQPLVLLRMFKALGPPEENVDEKERKKMEGGKKERRKKEGRMEKWKKTRTVLHVVLIHGSFENHEGREPILWKNTSMHKITYYF